MSLKEFFADPETRKWLYGISATMIPILVLGGHLTNEEGKAVLDLIAAILAVGTSALAIKNVPSGDPEE